MSNRRIKITKGFGQGIEDLIGHIELSYPDGKMADVLFSDINLAQSVFAPAYMKADDGTIELVEFSLIPAPDAKGLIERGMDKAKNE